jgi:hypothetical protein
MAFRALHGVENGGKFRLSGVREPHTARSIAKKPTATNANNKKHASLPALPVPKQI